VISDLSAPDLFSEGLLPLSDAAKLLPKRRAGKPTHKSTLFRWAQRGVRGVILETCQVGGVKCTSRAALARFFQRLTTGGISAPPQATAAGREREIQRAEAELARHGI
jgi:hypothetical protein